MPVNPLDYLKSLLQSSPTTGEGQDIELPAENFIGPKQPKPEVSPWRKAETIGASKVGERYAEPTNPTTFDLIRKFTGGAQRPRSVQAADPYGIEAWMKGAGDVPGLMMGSTEEVGGPLKKAVAGLKGFYSRVDKTAEDLPSALHPSKAEGIFRNNAAKEEVDYRGLSDFLKNNQTPKVTKAEIVQHLNDHPMPEIGVKDLGGEGAGKPKPGTLYDWEGPSPVKYDRPSLNVPGGENYRERLLTLPEKVDNPELSDADFQDWYYKRYAEDTDRTLESVRQHDPHMFRQYGNDRNNQVMEPQFQSSHWDEPNVLAHSRFDERHIPTQVEGPPHTPDDAYKRMYGDKGRFLQEVQSDWHQAGKEQGYTNPTEVATHQARLAEIKQQHQDLIRQIMPLQREESQLMQQGMHGSVRRQELSQQLSPLENQVDALQAEISRMSQMQVDKGIPDAPFKESWPDLVLKEHVLDVANNPDLNWLGFTTGDTQNKRYDLTKHVSKIEWEPHDSRQMPDKTAASGNGLLWTYDKAGTPINPGISMHQSEVANHIGQELAGRLFGGDNAERLSFGVGPYLEGVDLEMGGEGMKHFYDKKLPSALAKILKPFGGKVQLGEIPGEIRPLAARAEYSDNVLPNAGAHIGHVADIGREGNGPLAFTYPPVPYNGQTSADQAKAQAEELKALILKTNPSVNKKVPAWIAHLPPEMKKAIMEKGLPLLTLLGLTQANQSDSTPQGAMKGLKDAR